MGRIEKVRDWYITNRNYLNKGYEQVSWIKWLVQFTAYGSAIVYFLAPNVNLHWWSLVIVFLGAMVVCWAIGYFWDRYKFYHAEVDFSNKRNGFVEKVLDRLK